MLRLDLLGGVLFAMLAWGSGEPAGAPEALPVCPLAAAGAADVLPAPVIARLDVAEPGQPCSVIIGLRQRPETGSWEIDPQVAEGLAPIPNETAGSTCEAGSGPKPAKTARLWLRFSLESDADGVREILELSRDGGKTWKPHAIVRWPQRGFETGWL